MQQDQILNQEQFDQLMPTLIEAFKIVYNGKSSTISYNDTYSSVYRLCKKGRHQQIVKELVTVSQNYFKSVFSQLAINQKILESFETLITQLNQEIDRIMEILLYVETNYYHESKNQYQSLKDMLNAIMYIQLKNTPQILNEITKNIAQANIKGDTAKVNNILSAIINLKTHQQFFLEIFAPEYGNIMSKHYHQVTNDDFEKLTQKQYFLQCQSRIQNQREFLKKYFESEKTQSQINNLMNKFYNSIVSTQLQKIYKKDPQSLFQNNTCDFLQLLKEKGDSKDIEKHNEWFMEQIKKKLQKLDTTKNKQFLENFIKIYQEVNFSLAEMKKFNIRYKAVFFFEDWINEEKLQFPKRLSMYLQQHIIQQLNIQACMANFKELFKFLKEKDLFEKIFRTDLTMRMIYFAQNLELQKQIINQMSQQCGVEWLDKVYKVFDWPLTFDNTESSKKNIVLSLPNIMLIQDAVWPINHGKIIATLPKQLYQLQGFQESILQVEKSLKIKIQLHPFHGTALININFRTGKQQFKVDTNILSFLLYLEQLNSNTTLKKILNQSSYTLDQFKPAIEQLVTNKIITVQGNSDDQNSVIILNNQFTNTNELIDLTKCHIKTQFNIATAIHHQQLQPDRKTMVSALVIKAIKSSKVCSKQSLFQNVKPMIESRGFMFNEKFVNNIINDLVDRDFMKQTSQGYEYIPV